MILQPLYTGSSAAKEKLALLVDRFQDGDAGCRAAVSDILDRVKKTGNEAVLALCKRFDAPHMTEEKMRVSAQEMTAAYERVDDDFRETLEAAIVRIEDFHQREQEDSWIQTRENGTIVGRLIRPVDSAGLYVPGGQGGATPLVSSVLMNGIPAAIAGVSQRVMVSPPNEKMAVDPHLLVAAQEIGISEIYKIGSAWAIAALAYGTETVPAVDVIVGPGNRYVAEAKRQVSGKVRIDMIAGPSEVLIIADEEADAELIAADMLAQAEHDELAVALVITTDAAVAEKIPQELESQLKTLSREKIARKALEDFGAIFIADDLAEAIALANDIAIEHLELMIKDPWAQIPHLRHAGAIFMGNNTPEAAGDYFAGPNHVLPTMGTARFASALGVETFLKKSSIISYSASALAADGIHIQRLAVLEGLTAHGASVARRIQKMS